VCVTLALSSRYTIDVDSVEEKRLDYRTVVCFWCMVAHEAVVDMEISWAAKAGCGQAITTGPDNHDKQRHVSRSINLSMIWSNSTPRSGRDLALNKKASKQWCALARVTVGAERGQVSLPGMNWIRTCV